MVKAKSEKPSKEILKNSKNSRDTEKQSFSSDPKKEEISNLETLRHSCSHIMAAAVKKLFPDAKLGIGPTIEDGFYYDFDTEHKFTPEDFPKIQKEMNRIIEKNEKFERKELTASEAKKLFKDEPYKLELIKELEKEGEKISIYKTGDFTDLCRGPHVSSSREIKAFKLMKVAGAYWKGDEKNKQMQRIYGTAFDDKNHLADYLHFIEEAAKRDHRKIGKEQDLFIFSDIVGSGLPLWTPKGSIIRREIENFIVKEELKRGYQHVYTPELAKIDLYKKSGHYPYYKESMYPLMKIENEEFILRPMTCPHHFQLYLDKKRSYRELPMRIAELAKLFRYEKSGELSGLIRVRSFCLADAHIICRRTQAKDEISRALDLIEYCCEVLKIEKGKEYSYRLSLGDRSDNKKYYKDDAAWDEAEQIIREVLQSRDVPFYEAPGEAAFYGPKVDIQMKNAMGKEDTAFTVQYDFVMSKRFELDFVNENNEQEQAVVIHRSSIGCIERIIGLIIEKYAGAFPVWLSPTQVTIITVADRHEEFANKLKDEMLKANIRVEVDARQESIGRKIRDNQMQKIPYIITIGDREMESKELAIRTRDNKVENYKKEDFIKKVTKEIETRA